MPSPLSSFDGSSARLSARSLHSSSSRPSLRSVSHTQRNAGSPQDGAASPACAGSPDAAGAACGAGDGAAAVSEETTDGISFRDLDHEGKLHALEHAEPTYFGGFMSSSFIHLANDATIASDRHSALLQVQAANYPGSAVEARRLHKKGRLEERALLSVLGEHAERAMDALCGAVGSTSSISSSSGGDGGDGGAVGATPLGSGRTPPSASPRAGRPARRAQPRRRRFRHPTWSSR